MPLIFEVKLKIDEPDLDPIFNNSIKEINYYI